MSRLFAAIPVTIALLVATGCTRRQADFAMFAAEIAYAVAATPTETEGSPGVAVAAPNPDNDPGPSEADLQRAHDVASELTRIAAHDARVDNCAAVERTGHQVRVIDADVFVNVFLKDPPIQRCLALMP